MNEAGEMTHVKMMTNEDNQRNESRVVKTSYLWLRYKPLCRGLDSLLTSHLI